MKFVNDCVMPSFFPMNAVTVEDLAKLAPKFAPKLVLFTSPDVAAIDFVTALPRVLATAIPVVLAKLLETVFVSPLVSVSVAVFPSAFAVLLAHPLVDVVPSAKLEEVARASETLLLVPQL